MREIKTIFILFLIFMASQAFSQTGFIGKKVVISTDFYELAMDRSINLELGYLFKENMNLTAGFSLINTARTKPKLNTRAEEFFTGQRGFNFDLRFVYNSPLTGQVAPFGHYYGYAIGYLSIKQLADSKPIDHNSSTIKESPCHMLEVSSFYGKSFILNANLFLSVEVSVGVINSFQPDVSDFELYASSPLKYLPIVGFSNDDQLVLESNQYQFAWFLKPSVKLSYLIF